ncbi:MAG: carboxypeptidase regulatory-like domain-containing protein [Bacteroidetes bacterium]|nr:carboxypeptidase regulatory-like domain-containing protein [Bacteroidota bacterium]
MKAHHILLKLKMICLVLSAIILFNSCNKHNITPPLNNTDNSATIFGQIVKEDGTPLQGANVHVGVHSFITNTNGIFYFSDINTPLNATLIEVNKDNYFNGYRTLLITPNQDHYTRIMLMEKNSPQSLNAEAGGSIPVTGGGSIVFPSHALVYKSTPALQRKRHCTCEMDRPDRQ